MNGSDSWLATSIIGKVLSLNYHRKSKTQRLNLTGARPCNLIFLLGMVLNCGVRRGEC